MEALPKGIIECLTDDQQAAVVLFLVDIATIWRLLGIIKDGKVLCVFLR